MNERVGVEVKKIDLSQLSDGNLRDIISGEEYEYVTPIQEVDQYLADEIVTFATIMGDGMRVRGATKEMSDEWTSEFSVEGVKALNKQLSSLNISKRF